MAFAIVMAVVFFVVAAFLTYAAVQSEWDQGFFIFLTAIVSFIGTGFAGGAAMGTNQIGEGTYTGIPASIETEGVFWETTGTYLKTDREATTGENFCVVDPAVIAALKGYAEKGTRVIVEFTRHFMWEDGCVWEDQQVIRSVRPA